jgi:hypothetical protein
MPADRVEHGRHLARSAAGSGDVRVWSFEQLVIRVRAEYREMPGLRLTLAQACRLWQIPPTACQAVLHTLVDEGFLVRTPRGSFIALDAA